MSFLELIVPEHHTVEWRVAMYTVVVDGSSEILLCCQTNVS